MKCSWYEFANCIGVEDEEGLVCPERVMWVIGPTEFGSFALCGNHAEEATDLLPEVKMREAR